MDTRARERWRAYVTTAGAAGADDTAGVPIRDVRAVGDLLERLSRLEEIAGKVTEEMVNHAEVLNPRWSPPEGGCTCGEALAVLRALLKYKESRDAD